MATAPHASAPAKGRPRRTADAPQATRRSDPLLTPHEAADYLRLAVDTLKKYRYRGEGPAYVHAGKRAVRYPFSALVAWLDREQAA